MSHRLSVFFTTYGIDFKEMKKGTGHRINKNSLLEVKV